MSGVVRNSDDIWKSKKITADTKVKLYQSLVQSALLYNSETWTIKEEHKRKLRVFEMAVLRRICGITRHDRIRNMDVKKELNIKNDITAVLQQRRLRYFGHDLEWALIDIHTFFYTAKFIALDQSDDQERNG